MTVICRRSLNFSILERLNNDFSASDYVYTVTIVEKDEFLSTTDKIKLDGIKDIILVDNAEIDKIFA